MVRRIELLEECIYCCGRGSLLYISAIERLYVIDVRVSLGEMERLSYYCYNANCWYVRIRISIGLNCRFVCLWLRMGLILRLWLWVFFLVLVLVSAAHSLTLSLSLSFLLPLFCYFILFSVLYARAFDSTGADTDATMRLSESDHWIEARRWRTWCWGELGGIMRWERRERVSSRDWAC